MGDNQTHHFLYTIDNNKNMLPVNLYGQFCVLSSFGGRNRELPNKSQSY